MKANEIINEAAPNVKAIGVPEQLIKMVFPDANLENDVKPVSINSKKELMDLLRNNAIFAIGADGSAGAMVSRQSDWDRKPGAVLFKVSADGKTSRDWMTLSGAIAGLPRGKYYAAEFGNGGYYHARSTRDRDIARDNAARDKAGAINYVNKTFGAHIKKEAQKTIRHIKKIYFDANPRYTSYLKDYVTSLESFVKNGITKDNIERWLRYNNRYDGGWGSHYTNIESVVELMQEPAAAAKFAKHLLEWIRGIRNSANSYAGVSESVESGNKVPRNVLQRAVRR